MVCNANNAWEEGPISLRNPNNIIFCFYSFISSFAPLCNDMNFSCYSPPILCVECMVTKSTFTDFIPHNVIILFSSKRVLDLRLQKYRAARYEYLKNQILQHIMLYTILTTFKVFRLSSVKVAIVILSRIVCC